MKLPDSEIEQLNNWLARDYGYFNGTEPNWRIVWSDDEIEKRKVTHSDEGFELLYPIIVERPKYRQYIHQKYVLERLVPIPDGIETDMVGKFSYEPLFVYSNKDNEFLPPRYDVTRLIIFSVYTRASQRVGGPQYRDPRTEKDFAEMELARMEELKDYLWGNETDLTDNLAAGSGVGYTTSKEKVN